MVASRALFVPAPTRPRAKIALLATSESLSWLYLFRTSRTAKSGFDKEDRPRASGIARLAYIDPYLPI